jgi:hypothetical protein
VTHALQIKLLAAILAVLVVIAGLLLSGGRPSIQLTEQERKDQRQLEKKMSHVPSKKYLVP